MQPLKDFETSQLAETAAGLGASRVPGLEKWSDTIGGVVGEAVELTDTAEEVCK
jgi:hypothetical protein